MPAMLLGTSYEAEAPELCKAFAHLADEKALGAERAEVLSRLNHGEEARPAASGGRAGAISSGPMTSRAVGASRLSDSSSGCGSTEHRALVSCTPTSVRA
jgi:hypothetical protein